MKAKEAIDKLQEWSLDAAVKREVREWCLLGLDEPITQSSIAKLFDSSEVAEEYARRYVEKDPLKKRPHSFLQIEAHLIYGLRKAFTARHRTRLQHYRDDASQKAFHTRRTLMNAYAKFQAASDKAEASAGLQ